MTDGFVSIWTALGDQALEKRLRYYLWLLKVQPGTPQPRLEQMIAEAERRGKPELVEKARQWVKRSKVAPLL